MTYTVFQNWSLACLSNFTFCWETADQYDFVAVLIQNLNVIECFILLMCLPVQQIQGYCEVENIFLFILFACGTRDVHGK